MLPRSSKYLALSLFLSLTACRDSEDNDATAGACSPDAPESNDAGTDTNVAEDAATDATGTSPKHRVSSLVMTAGKSGAVVSYQVECSGCTKGVTGEIRGMTLKNTPDDVGTLWKVGEPFPITDPSARGTVYAASALGDDFHVVVENGDKSVALLGGAIPGGSVVSAAVNKRVSLGKQTQGATFGERINSGLAVSGAADKVWLPALDAASKDPARLMGVHVNTKGEILDSLEGPAGLTAAIFFIPPGSTTPISAYTTGVDGADGELRITFGGGTTFTAPERGRPAALWSDGKAFRAAFYQSNGAMFLWDGRATLRGPRVDETACSAVMFDESGRALVAHVGQKSTVLYVQRELDLLTPSFVEPSAVTIDPARVKSEYGINEQGVKRCAIAASGDEVYVAWAEPDDAKTAGPNAGLPSVIQVLTFQQSTAKLVRKTKHDTAKNSIGNIR